MNRDFASGLIKKKDPIIHLPIKVILTDEGINFFIKKNRKLHRYKKADSEIGWGFSLDDFSPASIQKMMLIDYISHVEISRLEFLSKRAEIVDINKLLVYTLLYKKFDRVVLHSILHSRMIEQWNRANPRHIIDEKTSLNENFLKTALMSKKELIQEIKLDILNPITQEIKQSTDLQLDEQIMQIMICQKLVNSMQPFSWYLLSTSKGAHDYYMLISSIKKIIKEFLEKTTVAEYISLIIMELAMNAENSNLQKYAHSIYQKEFNMDTLVSNKQIRNRILQKLQSKGEFLYLDWAIDSKSSSTGGALKLQITLYNKEYEYEVIKDKIEDKSNINLNEQPLYKIYEEIPETLLSSELGLYYLTYLRDACDKLQIRFDSKVGQLRKVDLPMISLSFKF
jgi:predicted transcriptional regulator YheO